MLITREYIAGRIGVLLAEKSARSHEASKKAKDLYNTKQRFPAWLRTILFHPFNPFYSVWKQYRQSKIRPNPNTKYLLHPFVVDFMTYCTSTDLHFDTQEFYQGQDEEIARFIDNRIQCVLAGVPEFPELEALQDDPAFVRFREGIEREGDFRVYRTPERTYYLPDPFEESTFFYRYGLTSLPVSVTAQIAGRDLLDIGAYSGDSVLMMLDYAPRRIYAYEPIAANYALLQKTIRRNGLEEVVETIKKGVGDRVTTATINSAADASTLQPSLHKDNSVETIEVTTVDAECRGRSVGLIKMDVEGFEYNVISRAGETIRRERPILLISAYHTGKDFFEIPALVRSYHPGYKFRFFNLNPRNPVSERIIIAYTD